MMLVGRTVIPVAVDSSRTSAMTIWSTLLNTAWARVSSFWQPVSSEAGAAMAAPITTRRGSTVIRQR